MPGNNIQHFAAIRFRVIGQGNLLLRVYPLDPVKDKILVPITMTTPSRVLKTRLVNFSAQAAAFELKTTNQTDYMRVNSIIIFAKETFSSYPGN